MPLTPYTVESFGGLQLLTDPFEIGAGNALDTTNVDLDRQGELRTRDGFTRVKTLTMDTADGLAVFDDEILKQQVIVGFTTGGTSKFEVYASTGGASIASQTVGASGGTIYGAVKISAASTDRLYLSNGVDTIWQWTGTAFSQPAGMPACNLLALTSDYRLAAGVIKPSNNSRVWFSDPGDPQVFGSSNYVDLDPGDGYLTGLVSWREFTFAFKQGAFFVFYGTSVDADGQPVFNYRRVKGYGAFSNPAAGEEGVYFFDGRRVWVTRGDTPSCISDPIEPFLRGRMTLNGDTIDLTRLGFYRLYYSLGRLYMPVDTNNGRRTLVFDPRSNAWLYWSTPVYGMASLRSAISSPKRTFWLSASGVEIFDESATADNGSAIAWSWTSGRYSLADPGVDVVTQESSLVGSGTVGMAVTTDMFGTLTGPGATLGTAPATAEGWPMTDQQGTWFSHRLSGTGVARVERLTHYISFTRPAGIR